MDVFVADTVVISFDKSKKILIQKWQGFSTSKTFRLAIDKTVSFVKQNPVRGIFNDTLEQGAVSPKDVQYASAAMPTLFQNGVKAMAIVLPKQVITKMSVDMFKRESSNAVVELFSDANKARSWLEKAVL